MERVASEAVLARALSWLRAHARSAGPGSDVWGTLHSWGRVSPAARAVIPSTAGARVPTRSESHPLAAVISAITAGCTVIVWPAAEGVIPSGPCR
jgi:hypothetical protein